VVLGQANLRGNVTARLAHDGKRSLLGAPQDTVTRAMRLR
jgi:hypothetical protein